MKIVMSGRRKDFDPGASCRAAVSAGSCVPGAGAVRDRHSGGGAPRGSEGVSRFDLCLPTVTALWVFPPRPTFCAGADRPLLLGLLALLLAGGAAVLANVLHDRGENEGQGATIAFMVAATALLGMGMWALTGGVLSALVVLSVCRLLSGCSRENLVDGWAARLSPTLCRSAAAFPWPFCFWGAVRVTDPASQIFAAGTAGRGRAVALSLVQTTAPLGNIRFFQQARPGGPVSGSPAAGRADVRFFSVA